MKSQKIAFPKVVPQIWNAAFCVSYAESSVTSKFELNTAILDFDRFEVSKKPIFRSSSRRPQVVRFVLVTVKAA